MTKLIPNTTILAITGKPYKIPVRNDDGEVEWADRERDIVKLEDATASSLLRLLILTLPREIQAPSDGMYMSQLWNDIIKADGAGTIEMHDKVYA